MRHLLWKEWHEQSWKLAFGCIVLSALALIGLRARIVADETILMWVCFLGMSLLPVLSSIGLIPAERAEGSFESLLAMPIAPWRILTAKTAIGILLCAGPLILALLVSLLVAGGREMTRLDMLDLFARSTMASLFLFMWMLAFTATLPSEARAGLVAVGVLICWILATEGLSRPAVPELAFATSPLAFIRAWQDGPEALSSLVALSVVQPVIAAVLWFYTVKSFNK